MRIALVGYGRFAPRHLEVLRALGCDVVAACNRSEEGRHRAVAEGGIPRAYGSISRMIEAERPDGVVCTAAFDRLWEAGREVLASGVPLLLEKPPGTTVAELDDLIGTAASRQTPALVGFNRRRYSVLRRALEEIGGRDAIRSVWIEWAEDPEGLLRRGDGEERVGRLIVGNSIHGLDLLTYLAGDVPGAAIHCRALGAPYRWTMGVQGVSERGVHASFVSTWVAPGRWRLTLSADRRQYVFAPLESCTVREPGGERLLEPDDDDRTFKAGLMAQARLFLECIRTGRVHAGEDLSSARPAMVLAERLAAALAAAPPAP
jgi:predicted dehydrogenase